VTQQGRDQLHANWPKLYPPADEARLPAEELLLLKPGGDYGWPQCYYDGVQKKLVLGPEYGGDGGKQAGVCANKIGPVASLPAHWAPNAMVRYENKQFPARYRNGVFIAFHGSWDRAPYMQGGYNVVFQALEGDHAPGNCEVFADGFAGPDESPAGAAHRPSGLAVGQTGVVCFRRHPGPNLPDCVQGRPCRRSLGDHPMPERHGPVREAVEVSAQPPEGTHANAGADATSKLPVPEGATPAMVALGDRITTARSAELLVKGAMARTLLALLWGLVLHPESGCGAMAAMPEF